MPVQSFQSISPTFLLPFNDAFEVAHDIHIPRTLVAYAFMVDKFLMCPNVTWVDDADLTYIPVKQSTRIGAFLSF